MRQSFSLVVAVLVLLTGSCAWAQQSKAIPRIGYLALVDAAGESPRAEGIRRALRARGYIEGQNFAIDYRYAEGKQARAPELAAELLRLKVDIILATGGASSIRAAMNATKTVPIVMSGQGVDPVAAGFVQSLARPGGNVTGFTILSPDLGGKRLELLKEAVPRANRVAVLYDPRSPASSTEVNELLPAAARTLKLLIQPWEIRSKDDFDNVFAAINKQRPDALHVIGSTLLRANSKRIVNFASNGRLPSMYNNKDYVEAGGLVYYGADQTESYQRVAYYIDRILKGAKPADLPVEQPTKFEFIINLKTAKQIGLTIPPNVLARADKVIR
jgi:putative ABC transport system substrate-binding protein